MERIIEITKAHLGELLLKVNAEGVEPSTFRAVI